MQFLPKRFSATGNYTHQEYTAAAAFRILFHAEVESFLEELALDITNKLEENIRNSMNCNGAEAILILYRPEAHGSPPSQLNEVSTRSFKMRAQLSCLNEMRRRISSNNGLKAHNLLSLFIPIGLDEIRLDDQMIIDLNLLGARRGDVAHKALLKISVLPDPKEEKILAERLIDQFKSFEQLALQALGS